MRQIGLAWLASIHFKEPPPHRRRTHQVVVALGSTSLLFCWATPVLIFRALGYSPASLGIELRRNVGKIIVDSDYFGHRRPRTSSDEKAKFETTAPSRSRDRMPGIRKGEPLRSRSLSERLSHGDYCHFATLRLLARLYEHFIILRHCPPDVAPLKFWLRREMGRCNGFRGNDRC